MMHDQLNHLKHTITKEWKIMKGVRKMTNERNFVEPSIHNDIY
jgi:hypothetical protein